MFIDYSALLPFFLKEREAMFLISNSGLDEGK